MARSRLRNHVVWRVGTASIRATSNRSQACSRRVRQGTEHLPLASRSLRRSKRTFVTSRRTMRTYRSRTSSVPSCNDMASATTSDMSRDDARSAWLHTTESVAPPGLAYFRCLCSTGLRPWLSAHAPPGAHRLTSRAGFKSWQPKAPYDAELHERNQFKHGSWVLGLLPSPAM